MASAYFIAFLAMDYSLPARRPYPAYPTDSSPATNSRTRHTAPARAGASL